MNLQIVAGWICAKFLRYSRDGDSVTLILVICGRKTSMSFTVKNLSCQRGGKWIFTDLHFQMAAGSLLKLTGPNGCGKSSLLRVLAGLLGGATGTFTLDGQDITADDIPYTGQFLYVGHQNGLKPGWTLRENLAVWAATLTGARPDDETLASCAANLGMAAILDNEVRYFSSGQAHRASLLRCGLVERKIWLLDEPTVGLDTANRDALFQMMRRHLDKGGMILTATHDPIDIAGDTLNVASFAPQGRQVDWTLVEDADD